MRRVLVVGGRFPENSPVIKSRPAAAKALILVGLHDVVLPVGMIMVFMFWLIDPPAASSVMASVITRTLITSDHVIPLLSGGLFFSAAVLML